MLLDIGNPRRGNGSEKQEHDTSQDRTGNRLQQSTHFSDKREDDTGNGSNTDDLRMGDLGNRHGTCNLGIRGNGRTAQDACGKTGKAIAEKGGESAPATEEAPAEETAEKDAE